MVKSVRSVLKISYTGCPGLFWCSLLLKCAPQPKFIKTVKPHVLGVYGHSRSLVLTPLKRWSLVLATINSVSVSICNYFYSRRTTSGKIITFYSHTPL